MQVEALRGRAREIKRLSDGGEGLHLDVILNIQIGLNFSEVLSIRCGDEGASVNIECVVCGASKIMWAEEEAS